MPVEMFEQAGKALQDDGLALRVAGAEAVMEHQDVAAAQVALQASDDSPGVAFDGVETPPGPRHQAQVETVQDRPQEGILDPRRGPEPAR